MVLSHCVYMAKELYAGAGRRQRGGALARPSWAMQDGIAERGHVPAGTEALLLLVAIRKSSMFPDGPGAEKASPDGLSHPL